jgi:hypothetical protein
VGLLVELRPHWLSPAHTLAAAARQTAEAGAQSHEPGRRFGLRQKFPHIQKCFRGAVTARPRSRRRGGAGARCSLDPHWRSPAHTLATAALRTAAAGAQSHEPGRSFRLRQKLPPIQTRFRVAVTAIGKRDQRLVATPPGLPNAGARGNASTCSPPRTPITLPHTSLEKSDRAGARYRIF